MDDPIPVPKVKAARVELKVERKVQMACGQCSSCLENGHWSRDCPNMSVNQVTDRQNVVPPSHAASPTEPKAKQVRHLWSGFFDLEPSSPFLLVFSVRYGQKSRGLVITPTSTVKLLRDACRWLRISQSGQRDECLIQ